VNRSSKSKSILNVWMSLCFLLVLSACTYGFQDIKVTGIPADVFEPGTQEFDIDILFETALQEVRKVLSGAYFQGMIFSGRCQDLPRLRGKLIFVFAQVRPAIPRQQVIRATVVIDTVRQVMEIDYGNVSAFYPSTKHRAFIGGQAIEEIAVASYQNVIKLGRCEGDITLTQFDDFWSVRCGSLNDFSQKCQFKIEYAEIGDSAK